MPPRIARGGPSKRGTTTSARGTAKSTRGKPATSTTRGGKAPANKTAKVCKSAL